MTKSPVGASPQLPDLLTIEELAAYCRVNRYTARDWLYQGVIPPEAVWRPTKRTLRLRGAVIASWLAGEISPFPPPHGKRGRPKLRTIQGGGHE